MGQERTFVDVGGDASHSGYLVPANSYARHCWMRQATYGQNMSVQERSFHTGWAVPTSGCHRRSFLLLGCHLQFFRASRRNVQISMHIFFRRRWLARQTSCRHSVAYVRLSVSSWHRWSDGRAAGSDIMCHFPLKRARGHRSASHRSSGVTAGLFRTDIRRLQ